MLLINKHCGAGAGAWPSETKLTYERVEVAAGDAAADPPSWQQSMKDRAAPDGAAAGNHPSKSRWERFDAFGLRPQLGILVCATALPLLALALLMVNQLVDLERQSTRTSLMNSARTLAALTDNEIDTYSAIAIALAESLALRNGDLATFWAQSEKALELVPGAWLELRDASDRRAPEHLAALSGCHAASKWRR